METLDNTREYWRTRCNYKVNDKKVVRIVEATRRGATRKLAAQYAGITARTLKNWLVIGEKIANKIEEDDGYEIAKHEEFYLDLWHKLCSVETEIQMQAFEQLQDAASDPNNWRAAESILKLRYTAEYGIAPNQANIDVSGNDSQPFKVTMTINARPEEEQGE